MVSGRMYEELASEIARLSTELAALTPGGSEFHNSPDNCIRWIKERLQNRAKIAGERNQLRKRIAAAEKIFNHFGGLSELMKWENGQGETAVDLIGDYLKL